MNIASRMMSSSDPGMIQVSAATKCFLERDPRPEFALEARRVQPKGMDEITVYAVKPTGVALERRTSSSPPL